MSEYPAVNVTASRSGQHRIVHVTIAQGAMALTVALSQDEARLFSDNLDREARKPLSDLPVFK